MVKTSEDLANYRIECASELELPHDKLENYKKFEYGDDDETKCYLNCSLTKAGLFHPEKGFDLENTVKQLARNHSMNNIEIIRTQIANCFDSNEQGSDACEWAFRGATCMVNVNLDMIKKSLSTYKDGAVESEDVDDN